MATKTVGISVGAGVGGEKPGGDGGHGGGGGLIRTAMTASPAWASEEEEINTDAA